VNSDDLEDEVKFWLYMIEWWETYKSEPVPKRMHEALALAKAKFRLTEDQHFTGRRKNH
jgi:hypothetical protein